MVFFIPFFPFFFEFFHGILIFNVVFKNAKKVKELFFIHLVTFINTFSLLRFMVRIVVDKKVRYGKPVLEGTRITVDDVLGMLEGGMTYEEIEKEYGLKRAQVLAVIRYAVSFVRGEEVHPIPA